MEAAFCYTVLCGMHEVGAFMGPGDSGKGEEDSSEMEILMKDCN